MDSVSLAKHMQLKAAKEEDPAGETCARCGKNNTFCDDAGFFYQRVEDEIGKVYRPVCRDCFIDLNPNWAKCEECQALSIEDCKPECSQGREGRGSAMNKRQKMSKELTLPRSEMDKELIELRHELMERLYLTKLTWDGKKYTPETCRAAQLIDAYTEMVIGHHTSCAEVKAEKLKKFREM